MISRRDFLKLAGLTTAACVVGAGGYAAVNTLTQSQSDVIRSNFAKILKERYGEAPGQELDRIINKDFQERILRLPFIGTSDENKWADNMPPAAFALSAYRVLAPGYATLEEVGHMLFEALQNSLNGIPSFIMKATYNEAATIEKLRALAARSQKRQYPQDWVFTFVEGDGVNFTYGVDVSECAIHKYLTSQKASELTRYLCLTDILTSEAMGKGLVRDQTLAEGCKVCNFRFMKGRPSYLYPLRDGWPPKFIGS